MIGIAELNQRATAKKTAARQSAARFPITSAISSPARIVVPIRPDIGITRDGLGRYRDSVSRHSLFLLRLSLATVFFWFGLLKVAGASPVAELLRQSLPFLAASPCLQLLGVVEITIGVGLLFDRVARQATALMMLHLLGTLSLFVIAPSMVFAPAFPVLSIDGEFVLKNVVLITSALVIMSHRSRT